MRADDPYDETHDLDDAHDLRMYVMDRLLDHAPSPTLVSPPAAAPRISPQPSRGVGLGHGRRRPKTRDERAAQIALYGPRARSGDVGPATPVRLTNSFRHCCQTNCGPGADTPRAA